MNTEQPSFETPEITPPGERVMADFKTLASDVEDLLKVTATDLSEKANDARSRLMAALERAQAAYSDWQIERVEAAKAAASKADNTIRTHPYESVGIAFGLGLVVGAILGRKRNAAGAGPES